SDFESSSGLFYESANNILNDKNMCNKPSREVSPHSEPERESPVRHSSSISQEEVDELFG
ncbi:30110_t:CDS:1, partial [Racocetra persica]